MPHVKIGYNNRFKRPVRTLFGVNYPPACARELLRQYTLAKYLSLYNGIVYLIDKLRYVTTGAADGRGFIGGVYLSSGTIETGEVNTALTYIDATTGLEVIDTTDGSGDFVIPVNGLASLTILGHFFPVEEKLGDYIGATDAEYYSLVSPVWAETDRLDSYADLNGYTLSDGVGRYWDDALTLLIPNGVVIAVGSGFEDDVDTGEIYVTDDDYIYVTDDGYIYVMEA